jgi:hypothetical protein
MVDAAIAKTFDTYKMLARTAELNAELQEKVTAYIKTLFEAGEKDEHRLAVCGLTFMRQLDGKTDPVKAGFTGL